MAPGAGSSPPPRRVPEPRICPGCSRIAIVASAAATPNGRQALRGSRSWTRPRPVARQATSQPSSAWLSTAPRVARTWGGRDVSRTGGARKARRPALRRPGCPKASHAPASSALASSGSRVSTRARARTRVATHPRSHLHGTASAGAWVRSSSSWASRARRRGGRRLPGRTPRCPAWRWATTAFGMNTTSAPLPHTRRHRSVGPAQSPSVGSIPDSACQVSARTSIPAESPL